MIHLTHHIYNTLLGVFILSVWSNLCSAAQLVNAEVEVIVAAGVYNFREMPVAVLGRMGAFGAIGNKVMALEDDGDDFVVRSFTLPDTINVEEFFFLTDKIVLKHERNVLWVSFDGRFDGICFANDDFHIAHATDSTLLVVQPESFFISEFSMTEKNIRANYRFIEPPLTAGMVDSSMIAVTTSTLYLVTSDDTIVLHHHPLPIVCAAITPMGIFFGTDDALWRLIGIDEVEHIASGGISHIFGGSRTLYVVDTVGNLYKFSFSGAETYNLHD